MKLAQDVLIALAICGSFAGMVWLVAKAPPPLMLALFAGWGFYCVLRLVRHYRGRT